MSYNFNLSTFLSEGTLPRQGMALSVTINSLDHGRLQRLSRRESQRQEETWQPF